LNFLFVLIALFRKVFWMAEAPRMKIDWQSAFLNERWVSFGQIFTYNSRSSPTIFAPIDRPWNLVADGFSAKILCSTLCSREV